MTRVLDEDEKGTRMVRTLGGEIRAEIRRSSDGIQLLALVFNDADLWDIVAGPADCVLGALPDFNLTPENVTGLTDEFRALWGVRKEPLCHHDSSRQLEGGGA